MKIKHIAINNFLSFQKADIDFTKYDGLTVIKGRNLDTGGSNGSGKSALIEAIYFGLTGNTIRKTNVTALVNAQAGSKCTVIIDLEHDGHEIQIYRSRKPSKLRLWIDGVEETTDHARNTQTKIEELLNTNPRVLLASMFFGQSNDTNFLDANPDEKRTIIKNFLNLDDIFEMRDRIRGYKSEYSSRIKFHEKLIERGHRDMSKLNLEWACANKPDPGITVEECEAQWEQYHEDKALLAALHQKKQKLQTDRRMINADEVCASCGSTLDVTQAKQMREELQVRIDLVTSEIKLLEPKTRKPEFHVSEVTAANDRGVQQVIEMQMESIQHNLEASEEKITENRKGYDVMRFWEKALSESGVIKYIIRNVLEFFNSKCNYYLGYLTDSMYYLQFDDELNEKILIGDVATPYISLSGGERRKINLAVMMALKDLLMFTDKNHSNILFLDEVAENIDEAGVSGLYNLLLDLKKTRNLFIITHNKHLKNMLESSPRITIEKEDGVSTVWQTQSSAN